MEAAVVYLSLQRIYQIDNFIRLQWSPREFLDVMLISQRLPPARGTLALNVVELLSALGTLLHVDSLAANGNDC